jgi:TetR/AcrR family acrAB operon transcriptional repressor
MRKTKAEAAITRQQLIDAALVVFSEKGYAATRLEDIAAQAGLTRGAIYWHFGNKADLYNTLLTNLGAEYEALVGQALAEGGTVLDLLRRVMVRSLEFLETNAEYRAMMELSLFKTEVTPDLSEGWEAKLRTNRDTLDSLAAMMQSGIAVGELRPDLTPIEAARSYLAYLNGLSTQWLMSRAHDPGFSLRRSAPELADIFVRGIAAAGKP